VIISCEKDKNENKKSECRVVMVRINEENVYDSILYEYNSRGRIIKSDLGGGNYTTYTYETNKVTENNYVSGSLSSTAIYTLGFNGYVMSSVRIRAGQTDPESSTAYDINEDGYLISEIEVKTNDSEDRKEIFYEYEDGNLIYKTYENLKTGYYSETEFEYYPDMLNKFNTNLTFKGKANINLVKKITLNSEIINLITNHSYQLDNKGYVTSEIITVGPSSKVQEYIYDCN
jgi:hypothetical protein